MSVAGQNESDGPTARSPRAHGSHGFKPGSITQFIVTQSMSNYSELIQRIFSHSRESRSETLRKLIYLSVNDDKNFRQHAAKIAEQLPSCLNQIEDEQLKLLSLQLLSEMATNYTQEIPVESYSFPQLVGLLSDENPEVRKGAHYLILMFIRRYEQIDQVLEGYLSKIRDAPEHWKILQKIIHSFQSLLVIEPKCITYGQDYNSMDSFVRALLEYRGHHHSLVQKASEQTVSSFIKNEYTPEILPKLDPLVTSELVEFAHKISVNLKPALKTATHKPDQDQVEIDAPCRKITTLEQLLEKLDSEKDWKMKSYAIEEISKELNSGVNANEFPEDLIEKVLDLTYDSNFKTCISAMNTLLTIVEDYQSKISSRHRQIEDVILDKICDLKMAVRQLANKILRKLYANHSKDFIRRLLNKLNNCSIVGKEEILGFLQETFTTNILVDHNLVLGEISNQLLNENTRVKIKAIDCLVKISVANDLEECKLILRKKLKKVYFDMFLERLKEKMGVEAPDAWEEKLMLKKGLTWQSSPKNPPLELAEKKAMTKVEFGNRKNFYETEQDFNYYSNEAFSKNQKPLATTSNSYKTSNTFDSCKNEQEAKRSKVEHSSYMSFEGNLGLNLEKSGVEEKRPPLKSNPINRRVRMDREEKSDLAVESREYMNKNVEEGEEYVEEKPKMKINKGRLRERSNIKKKEAEEEESHKTIPNEPFSIKKSASKKEHCIDYKATQYVSKEELAPVNDLRAMFKSVMTNLPKENDWNKQFEGLDGLRRIIRNHHEFYATLVDSLAAIMPEVLKLVECLRSSVAKNAMMTLSQMCEALKKAMDPYLQPIFIKLFKKAQDANSFIVEEVRKCMTSLCTYCSIHKITPILVSHSNSKSVAVKTKATLSLDKMLMRHEYDIDVLKENPKLVSMMNMMIVDGSSEVRGAAKDIFLAVADRNSLGEIESVFKRISTKDSWEKWRSILERDCNARKK